MDSRLLYSVTETLKKKLIWIPIDGEEWYHYGSGLNKPFSVVSEFIKKHLGLDNIYIVTNRKESRQLNKFEIEAAINNTSGKMNFILWDINLTKAIEFNKIGVLRKGEIQ